MARLVKKAAASGGFKLDSKERKLLVEVLKHELGETREQIYHTDTADFKDRLKERESLLRGLLERLTP